MKFALAGGQRVEASIKARGMCPVCSGEVIAKCGTRRVFHWAHQGVRDCDSWAGQSDWHLAWKNKFPIEWQEFVQHDPHTGERHIADVRTPHGLMVEFQRSHLDPQERVNREWFYRNMVWVVDGVRLPEDYPRFDKGKAELKPWKIPGCFLIASPGRCFPATWLDSSVPVIFDFRGLEESQPADQYRNGLWCLLPRRAAGSAWVIGMSREQFVQVAHSHSQLPVVQEMLALMADIRAAEAQEARRLAGIPMAGARASRFGRVRLPRKGKRPRW